jgi:hypothetical protein
VVELDDGQTIPVSANLTSTNDAVGRTDWPGVVQASGQNQVWLLNVAEGRLRIGERTGRLRGHQRRLRSARDRGQRDSAAVLTGDGNVRPRDPLDALHPKG